MKKRIMLGCAAGLLSLAATAQDETAPVEGEAAPEGATAAPTEPAAHAFKALDGRYYVSPSFSWVFADSGRQTDHGQAVSLAVGRGLNEAFAVEAFAQYNRFDHEEGNDTTDLIGIGVNSLFFPTTKAPAYLLLGAGYGDVSSHPGGDESYGTLLLNVGGGYWWKPFAFLNGASLRTDAVWRLDAHNDRRTGTTEANGRKAFQDILLSVGLNIPIGAAAAPPPPPPAEPVEVVPVATPPDSDGDGAPDDLDQCPDTPAGTAVDDKGCPVVAAKTCKAPEPGEKLDLAGCGMGDVIVLKGVSFDFNKDRLTPNAKTLLDGVGEALKAAPATNVELSGHTDGKGSEDYNQRLSDRRACSVARYLDGQGIDAGRMTPAGYGESKPVADNETDEGREQNRRVELKILHGAGAGLGSCGESASRPAPRIESAAAEPKPEPAREPAVEVEPPPAPVEDSSATAPSDSTPPVEEPAPTPSAPEPAPEPAAAAPASGVSADSMQMVPEGEVFGSSPPSRAAAPPAAAAPATGKRDAPASEATQMVPESEVFGSN